MKVTIAGVGAIGGFIGARLAASGHAQVSALARGETLKVLRQHGIRLYSGGEIVEILIPVSDNAHDLGIQDLLVIAVKGPALSLLAPALQPLIGPKTLILPAMNGIPWWFCQGGETFEPFGLQRVDPDGRITNSLPIDQTLGCVVHVGASCPSPGLVHHAMGNELIIGDAKGGTVRTERIARLLAQAGLVVKQSPNIRQDIWFKLWGNLTMNPVSALTGATVDRLLADPLVRDFCSTAMHEAAMIGERIGCRVTQQPEDRHAITRQLGAFKTSMLQDVEARRMIELDSIVGVTQEIGQHLGLKIPYIDAIFGLTRLMARIRGLYPDDTP